MTFQLMAWTAALHVLGGCTFAPKNISVEVKWDGIRKISAAPDRVTDIGCFFVNVSAADILVNYGPNSFGGRTPECLNLGVIAGPYSLSELTKGVKITVQPGNQRTIEILGAISAPLGSQCHNFSLPDYFNTTSPPQLYSLGSATTKIYVDSAVTVTSNYRAADARDRVAACAGNETGSGTVAEGPIRGVKAFAFFSTNPELRSFDFQSSANTVTFSDSATYSDTASSPMGLLFSDDFTRLVIPFADIVASQLHVYKVDKERSVVPATNFVAGTVESWGAFVVAPAAANFYGFSPSQVHSFQHAGNSTDELPPTGSPQVYLPIATPANVFAFVPQQSVAALARFTRGENGELIAGGLLSEIQVDLSNTSMVADRSYTRLFIAHGPSLDSYKISGNQVTLVYRLPIPTGGPSSLALNRAGTRLYVAQGSGNLQVSYYNIASDGTLSASYRQATIPHLGRLILEPTGKVLFIDNLPANLTYIILDDSFPGSMGPQFGLTQFGSSGNPTSAILPKTLSFAPKFE